MFTTFHLCTSTILAIFLLKIGFLEESLFLFAISGGILVDGDIIFTTLHRDCITHTPILWLSLTCISIFYPPIFFFCLFALIHVLFDSIDWGIMLYYPFNKRKIGFNVLKYIPETQKTLSDFIKTYFQNKHIKRLEIFAFVLAIFAILIETLN